MNRTFKVVFSKVRGTMVVASEAAATPHKKAAKTVIAAAAALAMGTVMAQGWDEPDGIDPTSNHYTAIEDLTQGQYNYVQSEGETGFVSISTEGDHVIEGKEIWVTATGSDTRSYALHAYGTGVKLTNTGKIYIQAGEGADSWSQKGMIAGGGATVVNEGDIVAKNAYGMTVETETDKASNIENGVHGTITVLKQGAGIELGGASGSMAVNNGTITASSDGDWAHGVLIKAPDFDARYTFTNNGRIVASGDATAIDIQEDNRKRQTEAVINLIEGSQIDGIVHVGEGTKVALNAQGTHDSFRLESQSDALTINVSGGAEITLEDDDVTDNGALISSVNIDDGRLNASIWQQDNKFKDVTVNDGGIFNITKLNSNVTDEDPSNDKLLLAKGSSYTLDGGKLYVAESEWMGALKVGEADTRGKLTIASGSYNFSTLEVAKQGTVIVNYGELTVGDLSFSNGKVGNEGSVVIGQDGSMNINGKLTAGGAKDALQVDGILKTDHSNFFNRTEDGEVWTKDESNIALVSGTGVLDLTGITGNYTLDQLGQIQKVFGEGMQVSLSEGTLNLQGVTLTGSAASGFYLADQVGQAENGSFTVSDETTLGSINFGSSQTASLSCNGEGKLLTLEGNGSDIFHFDPESTVGTVEATNLQLGSSVTSSGNVNVETLKVSGKFEVVGNYTAQIIEVTTGTEALVEGGLDVQRLRGEGTTKVQEDGVLKVGLIESEINVTGDGMLVLGTVPQNPNARDVVPPQVNGKVTVGYGDSNDHNNNNILTTNEAAGEALRVAISEGRFGENKTHLDGFYIDKTITLDAGGSIVVGTPGAGRQNGVAVGEDVATVIDMSAFSSGDVVFDAPGKVVFNGSGEGYLANLYSTKSIIWTAGQMADGLDNLNRMFDSSNAFLNGKFVHVDSDGDGTEDRTDLVVSINDDVTTDAGLKGALGSVLAEGANLDNQKVLAAIGGSSSGFVTDNGQLTNDGVRATKEYLAAPVTAGTYNMAYDSMELISNALIQRNLDAKKGLGVWADVFYGSNESDSLYGDSGYSSDIYGGMLGVDFGFGEGARVGAALSIGSGDGDSEGSVSKYSSDSDFWGLSVYAGKDFGGLTFTGDMSYLWLDNDIGGSVAGVSASESLDSTVFSLGVRADWKAYEGKVLQVVPHAGVRWAQIDVDDYRGLSMDKMNVIEMPIGVTVKGVFETASGWQVAPEIDFTAAPQIGDTEVETIIGDVDVIDNVYNASIGVNAGTDAVRFGLSYKYGFGNDGRSNNTFNLKASYLF